MHTTILLATLTLLCAVAAVPVPELPAQSIDLVKIPLSGDKELDILTLANQDGSSSFERNKRTIGILRELFPTLSQVTAKEIEPKSMTNAELIEQIRVARQINKENNNHINSNTDQETQASEKVADQQAQPAESSPQLDELTLDNEESDENRNKRFLNFGGFGASSSGSGQSSGGAGGSGNFLFDIIRLVSGSSGTEQSDEKENAPEGDTGKGDGYTEGIPGPVTRLFVLANRGLSNLIQDLILRIAQTSERVVNFKARLITSLI